MTDTSSPRAAVPRIEELSVKNYRALRDLQLRQMTPLTVFLGPNGSGKSTIFDVFAFLSECFSVGLRKAVDKRNRFRELRSRGADGPIVIELKYRETPNSSLITYHLAIDENQRGPFVAEEWLRWRRGQQGKPFRFLDFRNGAGQVISGEVPDESDDRIDQSLTSPDLLAVNTLGQFTNHPRVSALRRFITGWYFAHLALDSIPVTAAPDPHEHLSVSGDNLPNVIAYLEQRYPERLAEILSTLARHVPYLETVRTEVSRNQRLQLMFKDIPFSTPFPVSNVSDGTIKLLAYLVMLSDPDPPQMIGLEEPENQLHHAYSTGLRKVAVWHQQPHKSSSPPIPLTLSTVFRWKRRGCSSVTKTASPKPIVPLICAGLRSLWRKGHSSGVFGPRVILMRAIRSVSRAVGGIRANLWLLLGTLRSSLRKSRLRPSCRIYCLRYSSMQPLRSMFSRASQICCTICLPDSGGITGGCLMTGALWSCWMRMNKIVFAPRACSKLSRSRRAY